MTRSRRSGFPMPARAIHSTARVQGAAVLAAVLLAGCSAAQQHRHELDQFGFVFYADGAGGGSILTDWGRGVAQGLKQAGYPGDFRSFHWHTGLGVAADQSASVEYKRQQAEKLAGEISAYAAEHPGRPVHLVALSAGTAVAVFALEALPERYPVERVVLLGSSLSSHYDVSNALRRVRDRLYVFTSDKDAVLGGLVPLAGTADRQFCGACAAGLRGFHLSARADAATRALYTRIENIAWRPEFASSENYGGHTDAVNPAFVRTYVAPLLRADGPRFVEAGAAPIARDAQPSPR